MKKYHVIDADGNNFEVQEMDEEIVPACDEEKPQEPEVADEGEALSPEEIGALKRLAGAADKLLALIEAKDSDEDMNEDEPLEEKFAEDEEPEAEEKVVDTDEEEEKQIAHDSKKSIGAIEKKQIAVDDSLTDDIANAWAKRYGGTK